MLRYATIGQNIFVINKYFKLYLKKALKEYDLNSAEAMALLMLYGKSADSVVHPHFDELHGLGQQSGRTHDQLLAELHYDKGVMSRTIQSLEAKGFVRREPHPQDNRSRVICVTERAVELKPRLIAILQQWMQQLLNGVDDPQLLDALMRQLARNACACAETLPRLDEEKGGADGEE